LLTRKGSQVQTLSRPPPFWLLRALSALGGQHSSRAAAALRPQVCSPPNRMGPPELTTQDHHQPNDHGAWSPPPRPAPWSGTTPTTCPGGTWGTGEHLGVLVLPSQPTGTLALDQLPCRRGGAAACARAMRRPRSAVDPRASHPRPTQHHPFPSGPMRAGDHAARGPRRHVAPITPNGDGPPHEPFQGPARRGQRGCRAADTGGPSVRTPGWHRSRGHRTRGHRTSP
jgi:hypothetical protein